MHVRTASSYSFMGEMKGEKQQLKRTGVLKTGSRSAYQRSYSSCDASLGGNYDALKL